MTVVLALTEGGRTWVGCNDSKHISGRVYPGVKWFYAEEGVAVGAAGSSRGIDIIREHVHSIAGPVINADEVGNEGVIEAAHLEAMTRARNLFDAHGFQSHHLGAWVGDVRLIIASPRAVSTSCHALSCHRIPEGELAAIGSGSDYAWGADWMRNRGGNPGPYTRIYDALRAALAGTPETCPGHPWVAELTKDGFVQHEAG